MAYELIEHIEIGSGGAASIEFTSIPQDGVDLVCVMSGRSTAAGQTFDYLDITFNSDSGSNYGNIYLRGNGSSVTTADETAQSKLRAYFATTASTATASTFGNGEIYISNYTSSSNKSISLNLVTENNNTQAFQVLVAGSYTNTASISSIQASTTFGDLVEHSTASLYKVS